MVTSKPRTITQQRKKHFRNTKEIVGQFLLLILNCDKKDKPLSFEQWCSDVDIESQYEAFHDEYGDAAALLCEYKQYHYEEYLQSFESQ